MDENIIGGKFSIDISDLSKGLKQANRLINLSNSEFKAATAGMDNWKDSAEGVQARLKNLNAVVGLQEKKVEALQKEYDRLIDEGMDPTSKQAVDLQTKINKETAALEENRAEIKKCTEGFNDLDDSSKGASEGFTVMKGALSSLIADGFKALLNVVINNTKEMINFANEYEKTMNKLKASTGATAEELKEYDDIMSKLYKSNYGESIEDVGEALAIVVRNSKNLDPTNIELLTKNALILKDAFGYDVNETMRAANMLIDQFGLTGEEAFNLIAQGAQTSLDKNGDLLDTINEYSVHYKQLGFTSEEFLNSLVNGTEAGTFSVDKLGDAMKEFGIRTKDTAKSTTEGFELIGLDADKMREAFAKGGESARQATEITLSALLNMKDKVKQNQAGVALFGTMWEDLGVKGIKALTNVQGEMDKTNSTIEEMGDTLKKDAQSVWEEFSRTIKVDVIKPISKELLPKLKDLIKYLKNSSTVKDFTKSLTQFLSSLIEIGVKALPKVLNGIEFMMDNIQVIVPLILALVVGIKSYKVAVAAATVAQKAFNVAMNANVVGLVAGAIAGLAVGLGVLVKKANEAKVAETELTETLKEQDEELDELTEKINSSVEARNNLAETQKNTISEGLGEVAYVQQLKDELSGLVDENGKVKDGYKTRVKFILGELNEALGTEISLNGDVIKSYKKVQEEIDNLIEKEKAYIIWNAQKDSYEAAIKNVEKYKKEWIEANNAVESGREILIEADANREKAFKNLAKTLEKNHSIYSVEELMRHVNIDENGKASWKHVLDGRGTWWMYKDKIQEYATAQYEVEKSINNLATANNNLAETNKNLTQSQKDKIAYEQNAQDILDGNYQAVIDRDNSRVQSNAQSNAQELKDDAEYYANQSHILKMGLAEAEKKNDEFAIEKYNKEIENNDKSLQNTMSYLHQQTSTIENTSPEVIEAWRNLASSSTEQYESYLSGLPENEANVIRELVGTVGTEGQFLTNAWSQLVSSSLSSVTGKNVQFKDAGNGLVQMVVDGVEVGEPLAKVEMTSFAADLVKKVEDKEVDAEVAGKMLIDGVNTGVSNKEKQKGVLGVVGNFASLVIGRIKSAWDEHSPSRKSQKLAEYFMDGIGIGFENKEGSLLKQVGKFGNEVTSTLQNQLSKASNNLNATAKLGVDSSNGSLISNQSGNVTKIVNVYQTINSPKALDRSEVYRQTKNIATAISQGG